MDYVSRLETRVELADALAQALEPFDRFTKSCRQIGEVGPEVQLLVRRLTWAEFERLEQALADYRAAE